MVEAEQGTPPNLPTYNVRLSSDQIEAIVKLALPDYRTIESTQLPSGKSFNNRIYFVQTQPLSSVSLTGHDSSRQNLVLKVSGHYFGARKVQNEVGAVQVLRTYCPLLPIPQLVAWSEEGRVVQTFDGRTIDTSEPADNVNQTGALSQATTKQGWIMMTRLPGRPLTIADLDDPRGAHLLKRLASCVHSWRTSIPTTAHIGNLRSYDAKVPQDAQVPVFKIPVNLGLGTEITALPPQTSDFTIGGLLLCHDYDPSAISGIQSCYTYLARDQLSFLRDLPELKSLLAQIEDSVEDLINNTIPRLSFLRYPPPHTTAPGSPEQASNRSCFTHLDLSPRNILVSPIHAPDTHATETDRLEITGILDFEFATFFPPTEEFICLGVHQSSDWPAPHCDALLRELAAAGVDVPHSPHRPGARGVCRKDTEARCGCEDGAFEGLCVLAEVVAGIKPWFLQEGSHSGEELEVEIGKAVTVVREGIARLQDYVVQD